MSEIRVDTLTQTCHNGTYIRPLAVRPLTYLERVQSPWGFFYALLFPFSPSFVRSLS